MFEVIVILNRRSRQTKKERTTTVVLVTHGMIEIRMSEMTSCLCGKILPVSDRTIQLIWQNWYWYYYYY